MLGEVVAEEIVLLSELGEIPKVDLVLLAGDLFDYPDCRKLGGTGDVTPVWEAFSARFDTVVGVLGNHDILDTDALSDNAKILDGASVARKELRIGGVSGIIGRPDRNQRKEKAEFLEMLRRAILRRNDIVLLHQGPDDPESGQIGEPAVREVLEAQGNCFILFGHCFWPNPLVKQGGNHVLNVDSRVVVLMRPAE